MRLEMAQVPPPKRVPVSQIGETFGLVDGLHPERNDHGSFRCGKCRKWVKEGEWTVPVPDCVRSTDSAEEISEACRVNAFNGMFTSWCLACAPKKSFYSRVKSGSVKWWQFWK